MRGRGQHGGDPATGPEVSVTEAMQPMRKWAEKYTLINDRRSVRTDITEEDKKIEPIAQDDRLSENMKQLIDFVKTVPEEKVDLLLKVMKSIVEDD